MTTWSVNVGTISIIYDVLYNEKGDIEPGPNHIIKLADIYSNVHTDQQMTHCLHNLIQHVFVAKEKSKLSKLEKFSNFIN
jgi:hypothetical protein